MKVEYISHACLLIDTVDLRLAFDPWFAGPAYSQQWHVFPQPINAQAVEAADVIAISHGHEDHFHAKTLRALSNKSARDAAELRRMFDLPDATDIIHSPASRNPTDNVRFKVEPKPSKI